MLGSLEFACAVAGAKVIFVLGHEYCGAVKGAIDKVELGNLTALLGIITPAVDEVDELDGYDGARVASNAAFVHRVAEQNVRRSVRRIREESPILRTLEETGQICIVGGMYDMDTSVVELLT